LTRRSLELTPFDEVEALRAAVENDEYRVGIVLPDDVMDTLTNGETTITAYYPPGIPADLNAAFNDLLTLVFNEISYAADEDPINITRHETTLGYDLAGESLPPRNRLLPMFAVLLFMMETLALANLITEEIERGTLRALLMTPLSLNTFFAGKSVTGIVIGLVQATLLMLVTGKLGVNPLLVLTVLLLGALLVTGVGFLIASVARDMMSVISWGTLAIIILGIPSVSIMFPGTISNWIELIPSFYLVDGLHRIVNFGAGWSDVSRHLLILVVSGSIMLVLGTTVLRSKLR
jgi:ABC-2 type transport system permease protein